MPPPTTDTPAYACVPCRTSFTTPAQLVAHVKAVHAATLQRPRPTTRRPARHR
ncbi:hypothetical protein [Pseudofrankia inefficax]|uniref:Zinc finger, C2H2-like protein n=1 Tax=Pseudofrankia inefficax (strain DSM 45817 / CECT 9037 / DDB 130130 / EuI1c) TaxID=298654 RepID=E3JDR1_PSEI1|nr:hypothetical protein [Pseudofrankia inefficax]ADP84827.1 Zinc finger, C2H2-like protein [Pseudofrankia inefficax]